MYTSILCCEVEYPNTEGLDTYRRERCHLSKMAWNWECIDEFERIVQHVIFVTNESDSMHSERRWAIFREKKPYYTLTLELRSTQHPKHELPKLRPRNINLLARLNEHDSMHSESLLVYADVYPHSMTCQIIIG